MKGGVLKVTDRKLYPGYVFVEMACEEDGSIPDNVWFLVKETSGVGDFIGADGKPTSMPEHDVVQMLATRRCISEGFQHRPSTERKTVGIEQLIPSLASK